jgi:hypothetical protein
LALKPIAAGGPTMGNRVQQQADSAGQASYAKAFAACIEGRGYTVK